MSEPNDVSIVFMPEQLDKAPPQLVEEVLRNVSGCPVKVMRYGKIDDSDESIRDVLISSGSEPTLIHVDAESRRFEFEMNDTLSKLDGALLVDITFASAYHAARAVYFGLYGRLEIVYHTLGSDGPRREIMNRAIIDYGRLAEDDIIIVMAVASRCDTVLKIVEETGFSDKKVYRRLGELVRKGYVDSDDSRKQKIFRLNSDQATMLQMTLGIGC